MIDFATLKLVPNREVGLPLLRRPRHSGSVSVAYIGDRFNANLDGLFIGKRRDGDPVSFLRFDPQGRPIYNNGYAKLDLAGAYRFNSYISAFARIENLLNQDYQEVLGYPAYRLNFSAGMRFRIGGGNKIGENGRRRQNASHYAFTYFRLAFTQSRKARRIAITPSFKP